MFRMGNILSGKIQYGQLWHNFAHQFSGLWCNFSSAWGRGGILSGKQVVLLPFTLCLDSPKCNGFVGPLFGAVWQC